MLRNIFLNPPFGADSQIVPNHQPLSFRLLQPNRASHQASIFALSITLEQPNVRFCLLWLRGYVLDLDIKPYAPETDLPFTS